MPPLATYEPGQLLTAGGGGRTLFYFVNNIMKRKSISTLLKSRVLIRFNTGTRVEKQKKGKGSYTRRDKFNRYPSFSF
jgi:stalled ribosome alternative rescue factor ArfA